jgi:hypothetical protein
LTCIREAAADVRLRNVAARLRNLATHAVCGVGLNASALVLSGVRA